MTPDELVKLIEGESETWRKRENLYQQAKESVPGNPAACLHWFIWVLKRHRRLCRQFLRSRFRYDVTRRRFLRSSLSSRPFKTQYEFELFAVFFCEYINFNRQFNAGWRAFTNAFWEEEDPHEVVAKTLAAISQEKEDSTCYSLWMKQVKDFLGWDVFDQDVALLSGWVASQPLNTNLNSRLRNSLKLRGGDVRANMIEDLPGSVLLATNNRQPGEWVRYDKKALLNSITQLLAVEQPLEAKHNTLSEKAKVKIETPSTSFEDFVLREEARSEIARIEAMKLARREVELLNLLSQDPESGSSELAAKMNTSAENVDVIRHRLRKKVRSS